MSDPAALSDGRGETALLDPTARLLHETLSARPIEHTSSSLGAGDPWPLVRRAVARRRRRQRAVVVCAGLAVAMGVGALAVALPWEGTGTDSNVADRGDRWALGDDVARGDLAADPRTAGDLQTQIAELLSGSEVQGGSILPPLDAADVHLAYADDLGNHRVVVAVLRAELAGAPATVKVELTGTTGTAGRGLEPAQVQVVDESVAPVVTVAYVAESESRLFGLVPEGARVEVSPRAVIDADGAVSREWFDAEVSPDGEVDVSLGQGGDGRGGGLAVLRVVSAPGFPEGAPVAEDMVAWPASGSPSADRLAVEDAARQVAEREMEERTSAGEADPGVPVPTDVIADDVTVALEGVGPVDADDVRLLSATSGGADPAMGEGSTSTLVTVMQGGGSLLRWTLHDASGGVMGAYSSTIPAGAEDDGQSAWRVALPDGRHAVAIWNPKGMSGAITVDGTEPFLPLVDGLRWFPVEASATVLVDGGEVTVEEPDPSVRPWPLPGEDDGPDPYFHQ